MFNYIKGIVSDKYEGLLILETPGGIGYEIHTTEHLLSKSKLGEQTCIYVSMIVRDDDISLYGFNDKYEQYLFKELLKVSGVGAKVAISLLNELPASEISNAIIFQRPEELARANGIGKKTAQRIVIDLGEKLGKIKDGNIINIESTPKGDVKTEALEALISLGYGKSESISILNKIKDEDLTVEEYITIALKNYKG